MSQLLPQCTLCIHFDEEEGSCPAFDKIPEEILLWKTRHDHVRPDQKGAWVYTAMVDDYEYRALCHPETLKPRQKASNE